MQFSGLFRVFLGAAGMLAATAPAQADPLSVTARIERGQGASGSVAVHADWTAEGDLVVTIDRADITFAAGAGFNNLDKTGGQLTIQGLLLVPQKDGTVIDRDKRVLVPLSNLTGANGTYSCAACGTGTVPKDSLAKSDRIVQTLVIDDLILFMQDDGVLPVSNPGAPPPPAEASLAEIARRANLPLASLPNLQDLQAEDYSLLQSALDGIEDETTLDAVAKSVLSTAVIQAADMAWSPILQKFVFDKFALQSRIIFKGVLADPLAYAGEAGAATGAGLVKDVAIGVAGSMVADFMFSWKPLATLPPEWKAPMHAMTKAIFVESVAAGTSAVSPSQAVATSAQRLYEFYEIYKASLALADVQNEAAVAAAVSLETAARLVTLNPSEKNNALAISSVNEAVAALNQAFGDGYSLAMTEIVNLTFVGLLSEFRGDHARAAQMVAHIRDKGQLGSDTAIPDVLAHPLNWIASFASFSGDPPSRVAALMISATALGRIGDATPTQPTLPGSTDLWGPDVVPGVEVGYQACVGRSADDSCLRELGLSDAAIKLSHFLAGDYSGAAVPTVFQELGLVDLAIVEYRGARTWFEAVLLNGPVGMARVRSTDNLEESFTDVESVRLLREYPGASVTSTGYYTPVSAQRVLADGTQRLVQREMVTEGCSACSPIGTAITFLETGPATGDRVVRRPIGIGYDPTLPGMDMNLTPDVFRESPSLLQFYLNKLGYDAGAMDGYPGPQTRQALMEFQVEHCLVPTGQLTDETANAVLSADPFAAPCAGARLPEGISANTPLSRGVYVELPVACDNAILPNPSSTTHIIDGIEHHFDSLDQTCRISRTDIVGRLTKFSAQCTNEGSDWEKSNWFAEVSGNESFDILWDKTDTPRSFFRCDEDTPLAKLVFGPDVGSAAGLSVGGLPLIGHTEDLFNLPEYLLGSPCDEACTIPGHAATYTAAPLAALPTDGIVRVTDLLFEQGISRVWPPDLSAGYPPLDRKGAYRLWSLIRTDCEASVCPAAVIALLPEEIEAYGDYPSYSGSPGRFLDMRPGYRFSADSAAAALAAPASQAPGAGSDLPQQGDGTVPPSPSAGTEQSLLGTFGYDDPRLEANCSIGPINISATRIEFYESTCTLDTAIPNGAVRHQTDATCSGEGETWRQPISIEAAAEGTILLIANGDGSVYRRCAEGAQAAEFLGSWYDGGPYCASISPLDREERYLLRLWYCEAGIEAAAEAEFDFSGGILEAVDGDAAISLSNDGAIEIELGSMVLVDRFGNTYEGNSPIYSKDFVRASADVDPQNAADPHGSQDSSSRSDHLLATLAGHAYQGDVRTRPKYANGPIAHYDVQIAIDDRGTATFRAGIHSPPWACTAALTPVSVDGARVTFHFTRTKGGDDMIIRCPDSGRISLVIGSPAGPQDFAWESLGEDNASGSLAPLDAETFAAQQPPPDVNPCADTAWQEPIRSPVDLLICDQARALALLADEHQLVFPIPKSGLSFRNGQYSTSYSTRGTKVENTLKSMDVNGTQSWDEWFQVTQATIYQVSCTFDAKEQPDLSAGERRVTARLIDFDGHNVRFSCQ